MKMLDFSIYYHESRVMGIPWYYKSPMKRVMDFFIYHENAGFTMKVAYGYFMGS